MQVAVAGVIGAALLGLLAGMGMQPGDDLQQDRYAPQLIEADTRSEPGSDWRPGRVPDYVVGTDNLAPPATWTETAWTDVAPEPAWVRVSEAELAEPAIAAPSLTALTAPAADDFAASTTLPPSLGGGLSLTAAVAVEPAPAKLTTRVEPEGPSAD